MRTLGGLMGCDSPSLGLGTASCANEGWGADGVMGLGTGHVGRQWGACWPRFGGDPPTSETEQAGKEIYSELEAFPNSSVTGTQET